MKRASNYRSLRITLHIDFDGVTLRNKEHLKELMQYKGYHLTGRGLETYSEPTYKQLDFAWNELKISYEDEKPTAKTIMLNFKREDYKRHYVLRATDYITYKGKIYKKGQFLPRSIKG
jgi:hypothetical protein